MQSLALKAPCQIIEKHALNPNHKARLVISEGLDKVKRTFREANGEKVEATMLERVDNKVRSTTSRASAAGFQWTPETRLFVFKSVEYFVPALVLRVSTSTVSEALLSFFLCWNRCTGVAPTLNISLLLKRSFLGLQRARHVHTLA